MIIAGRINKPSHTFLHVWPTNPSSFWSNIKECCTGATKLISLADLYNDVNWESLSDRKRNHKLIQLYKMKRCLKPSYLLSVVPDLVGLNTAYNLCNSQNINTIRKRTTLYYNSFLPTALLEWNSLQVETR
jgi:hypothetical protein